MIVYLKDGSNVKGTVTVNDAEGTIVVVDKDHETHYYQKTMVAKIEEQPQHNSDIKTHGYVCNIELGATDVFAKDGGGNIPAFSFDVVNSYLFSPCFSLGLGIGTDLASSGLNAEMLSIYADSRIYFTKSNIAPYLDLAVGYDGMFLKYAQYNNNVYYYLPPTYVLDKAQGMMFNPSLGIRVAVSKKAAITAGIGYKLYYLHTNNDPYYTLSENQTFRQDGHGYYLFNALTIKAGFQF
jgi:hypothetical protein